MARVTGLEPATSGVTGRHSNQLSYTRKLKKNSSVKNSIQTVDIERQMARVTGLEPATSGVTGRHSNQLSYTRVASQARWALFTPGDPAVSSFPR